MQHNRILTFLAATAVVLVAGLSPPVTGVAHAATFTVQAGGVSGAYWFLPQDLGNINVGDTIIWQIVSGTHNVQSANIPAGASRWISPNLASGATFSRTFTVPGNYRYFCFHARADEANATPQVTNRQIGQFTVVADPTATPTPILTPTPTPTATPVQTVKVTLLGMKIVVTPKIVPRGEVVFEVTNKGKKSHDFKIVGKKTPLLAPGKSAKLSVSFPKASPNAYRFNIASYRFISTGRGHAMEGVFKVRRPSPIGPIGPIGLTGLTFTLSKITYVTGTPVLVTPGLTGIAQALCPAGDKVISGGGTGGSGIPIISSTPILPLGNGWEIKATNTNTQTRGVTIEAYAVCAAP